LYFSEKQIQALAPNASALNAGMGLAAVSKWQLLGKSNRAFWGEIKGSGQKSYLTQVDLRSPAYKCTCPSRIFPCKHAIAIMLLSVDSLKEFQDLTEPEWVESWINKRLTKEEEPGKSKEQSSGENEKSNKGREKTQAERMLSVQTGVAELELWLKDLIKVGLMELPSRPLSDFNKVASRMVDAKATGLAGAVKALAALNYNDSNAWPDKALKIIAKLFLLISAFKNLENLSPLWQITIKNLVGWNQSTKDLLTDPDAETVKDQWLVVGQESEENDDILIHRTWLVGCASNKKALILQFTTKFSKPENLLPAGSIIDAQLVFFPSILTHRAIIKVYTIRQTLQSQPSFFSNWEEVLTHISEQLAINPWINDLVVVLDQCRLTEQNGQWAIMDKDKCIQPADERFSLKSIMNWMALSGNRPLKLIFLFRNEKILPLGILDDLNYKLL
jgi:hypothetical protein